MGIDEDAFNWPYESYEEATMDLGLDEEALLATLYPICPRTNKPAVTVDGHVIDCSKCNECGELPF